MKHDFSIEEGPGFHGQQVLRRNQLEIASDVGLFNSEDAKMNFVMH